MDIKIKVGLKIKELRKQKGLTQEQLSELTEIDRTYISDVERGLRNIAIVNLDKIAKAFDVELFELLKF
jgi:transcriptional regulator with XRE-family HTH domain